MADNYDLLVIGAGSAGLAAAKRAAQHGATVAIAEQHQVGGVCVNRGCIPKKLMVHVADFAQAIANAQEYGWAVQSGPLNWSHFIAARDRELERIRQAQQQALQEAGVTLVSGHAEFVDAHRVTVGDRTLTARYILLAIGGKPIKPPIPGIEQTLTSDDMFGLQELPARMAIIGGGYIGVEFASMLCALGVEVSLLNKEDCILTGFEDELRHQVLDGLVQRGIRSLCSTTAKEIRTTGDGIQLALTGASSDILTVDRVLCATGRTPHLETLHLDRVGVEIDGKAIAVDDQSRTSQPHIFAVGDCTSRLPLTPAARAEGQAMADTVFGNCPWTVDYASIPSAVFARPEAASVGLTEAQARDQWGDDIQCDRITVQTLDSQLTTTPQKVWMKQIYDSSERLVGVHLVGPQAAELIQGIALAMKQGVTRSDIRAMIGIHPTIAEEFFE